MPVNPTVNESEGGTYVLKDFSVLSSHLRAIIAINNNIDTNLSDIFLCKI